MSFFNLLLLALVASCIHGLDVYFIRHGARAPLEAPMQGIFGAAPENLTDPGRSQSFYLGEELRKRHPKTYSNQLAVYSTDTNRTIMTAEYFLKGWHGMRKKGERWIEISPYYLPPYPISFKPRYKYFFTNQSEYEKQIFSIPQFEDKTGRKYGPTNYTNMEGVQNLTTRVESNRQICTKFQKFSTGSCKEATIQSYFLLKDITRCLQYIDITVPDVTLKELQLLTDVVNFDYEYQFNQMVYPTQGVQQDFYLIQKYYQVSRNHVVVEFTHDTQLLHTIRSLIGIQETSRMFNGKMQMDFLSTLHYHLADGIAHIFFNDKEFFLSRCGYKPCKIQELFKIMNA